MQLRVWPFVVILILAGFAAFLFVEDRAPGEGALSAAPTAQRPDVVDSRATLGDAPSDVGPRHTRTAPTAARDEQQQPAPERKVLQRFLVSVTDDTGAPVPGATLDVEVHGAGANSARLEVTAAGDAHPHSKTFGLAAGGGEALVVSVFSPEARELMLRAFADGWRPETRIVPVTAKDGRQEDVVLVLRRGASVSGRLLDGDGESVRRGQLALGADEDSAHVQAILITDSTGHFEAAVRTTGEVAAHALSRGVGRSVSRALFLPEGRRTEAGDFVLLGPGRISGRALLRDGTLLAKVNVDANVQGTAPGPGLRTATAKCDDAGRFELTGLTVGSFSLSVAAEANAAPDLSGRLVATGTEEYELVVDAVLLTVRAVDDEGATVPMASFEVSSVVSPNAPSHASDIGSSSTQKNFPAPIEAHEWLVPATRSFLLRAHGVDGASYFGFIEAGQPSGRVAIDLVARPATLGSIVLCAESPEMPADAALEVNWLQTGSRYVNVISRVERDGREHGAPLLREIAGLLPGSYQMQLSLARGGPVALVESKATILVAPGEVSEFAVETYIGGTVELRVDSPRAGEARAFVQCETRALGATEWQPLVVRFSELDGEGQGSGELTGGRVLLGGPAARSAPLRPGDHELRLTEGRHHPMTTSYRIDPGVTTSLRLQLTPLE